MFSGIAKVLKDKKYLYRIYSIENWVYYTFFTRKVIRSFFWFVIWLSACNIKCESIKIIIIKTKILLVNNETSDVHNFKNT